ncbi:MAG TPA: PDZ domain-containing protein [Bryobacteraceae bacterium]|nr:PDZ domain-containing protein [Bryobacteraceae bacterium]
MKKLFSLIVVFSAGAWAQGPDFFQAPGIQGAQAAREFNSVPFVGGTYLGVNLAEIDANRAKELKLKEDYGAEITRVEESSPAEKAGLKPGDVVLEYNGQRVEGMEQFGRMVRETPPGREVKLTISRNGATQTLTALLGTRKFRFSGNFPSGFEVPEFHMPDIPQVFTTLRSPMLGVEAESLGPQLAVYFGVKEGVLVRSVLDNTPAQKAGIKAGDVITKVDGMAVTTPSELSSAVRAANGSAKTYNIELTHDHKPVTVSVSVEDRSERQIPRGRVVQNNLTN